ncbi:hypothetical protein BGX24_003880 [Mortierella sp. AD032]|nr:hypothetical protein BGX24_003880 [Mortierella sp. AD032]
MSTLIPTATTTSTSPTATAAEDYVFVSVRPRVTSTPTPDLRTLTSPSTNVYQPIIYFAETRTVRHMHELCSSEVAFQQQTISDSVTDH